MQKRSPTRLSVLVVLWVGSACSAPSETKDDDTAGSTTETGRDGDGDGDGDGHSVDQGDCDDTDATVYPGADELCNGVDDNCDSLVDNDAIDAVAWYPDADGDGFASTDSVASMRCEAPANHVGEGGDCDDDDAQVHPDAEEICDRDGIDDNCNGEANEVCWWGDQSIEDSHARYLGEPGAEALAKLIPDVTGDGIPDVVVQSGRHTVDGDTERGKAWVHAGGSVTGDVAPEAALASFEGTAAGQKLGRIVRFADDLNNDGHADLLFPARYASPQSSSHFEGRAWVAFGPMSGTNVPIDSVDLVVSTTGAISLGTDGTVGDLNGDGQVDLIISAEHTGTNHGAVIVFYGPHTTGELDRGTHQDVSLTAPGAQDNGGARVVSGEDLDGDGFDDMVASAPNNDEGANNAGAVFVIGGSGLVDGNYGLAAAGSMLIASEAGAYLGNGSVDLLGDIDDDGYGDFSVTAPYEDGCGRTDNGVAHIVLGESNLDGRRDTVSLLSATTDLMVCGAADNDGGVTVSSADLDADGQLDLLVRASSTAAGPGFVRGVYGGAVALSAETLDLATPPQGWSFQEDGSFEIGSRATVGDLNADGQPDLLLSARGLVGSSGDEGGGLVFFGL